MIPTYFNFKRYDIFDKNQNKKITVLNYGEAHGYSPLLDFENKFKNYKTGFYVESNISLLDIKYCNFWFFMDSSTKEGAEYRKEHYGFPPPIGYSNIERLRRYFKDYYKDYVFENPNDKKLMSKKKEINKKFSFYPCDNRSEPYMGNVLVDFDMLSGLINKYFINKYKLPLTISTKYYLNKFVCKHDYIELTHGIYKSFDVFKECFMRVYDKYYSYKKHEDVVKKIYKTMKKYINEDYEKMSSSISNKSIAEYIETIDPYKMTIDVFNCYTFYQYEEELKQPIQKPIHLFIKKLFKDSSVLKIIPDNSHISVYDILLWMNFNKNMWKNQINVLYSGAHHSILFGEYIKVLVEYNGYSIA